jgi:hypothetical protein
MRRMCALCVLLILAASTVSVADVPRTISYQGVLKNAAGTVVPDGDYDLSFRLYDADAGGAALWTENQTLPVRGGVFNAVLGSVTTLDLAFDAPYWLGVSVGGDPELTPSTELTSAPYALRAAAVDSIEGLDAFADTAHVHDGIYYRKSELNSAGTINDSANPVDWTKLKSVPADFADGVDDVGGAGDGYSLDAADGSPTDVVYVDDEGDVGVGTTGPTDALDVRVPNGVSGGVTIGHETSYNGHPTLTFKVAGNDVAELFSHQIGQHLILQTEPGRGDIKFYPEGTFAMIATGSGVGIGEGEPSEMLDVAGTAQVTGFKMPTGASDSYVLTSDGSGEGTWQAPAALPDGDWTVSGSDMYSAVAGSVGIGTTTPAAKLDVMNTGTGMSFRVDDEESDSTPFIIDESGNVAIGKTSPDAKLDVEGNVSIADNLSAGSAEFNGDVYADGELQTSGGFRMPDGASSGYVLTSDSSGLGTWQSPASVSDGDWTVSGTDIYSTVSGNVGIGTTTPSEKLEVTGTVKIGDMSLSSESITCSGDSWFEFGEEKFFMNGGTYFQEPVTVESPYQLRAYGDVLMPGLVEAGQVQASGILADEAEFGGLTLDSSARIGLGDSVPDARLDILNTGTDASLRIDDDTDGDSTPFIIDADGNVGIGTATPTAKLDIVGDASVGGSLIRAGNSVWDEGNDGSGSGLDADLLDGRDSSAFSDTTHVHDGLYYRESELNTAGTINDSGNPVDWTKLKSVPAGFADGVDDVGGAGDGHSLDAADGSPSDVVYVDNDGEVGIGTTDPSDVLEVRVPSGVTGGLTIQQTSFMNGHPTLIFKVAGNDVAKLFSHQAGQHLILQTEPGRGDIKFFPEGTFSMIATGSGVGIGEGEPSEMLDVAGTAKVTGFKLPTGASDGYVLTSDGSGAGTWQAPAAVPDEDWTVSGDDMYSAVAGSVGIGTATPAAKLDVVGDASVSGSLTRAGNAVWDAGNDGSGSGLDADLLDGQDSSAFSDTSHVHDGLYYRESELNTAGAINDAGNPVDWTKLKSVPAGFADGVDDAGLGDGHSLDAADGSPTDAVYVDNDGNVGIGMATPDATLDVLGNLKLSRTSLYQADWEAYISHSSPSDYGSLIFRPSLATAQLVVVDSSAVEIACVDASSGNVGIGTNAPTERLDVAGAARMTGFKMPTGAADSYVLTSDGSGAGTWQAPAAVSDGDWTVSGNDLYSAVAGSIGIGTTSPTERLHVEGNVYVADTLFASAVSSNSPLELQTDGITRVHVDDVSGNVGIGTSAPAEKLEVDGTVKATSLAGAGQGLTDLDATNLTAGVVSPDRIAVNSLGASKQQWPVPFTLTTPEPSSAGSGNSTSWTAVGGWWRASLTSMGHTRGRAIAWANVPPVGSGGSIQFRLRNWDGATIVEWDWSNPPFNAMDFKMPVSSDEFTLPSAIYGKYIWEYKFTGEPLAGAQWAANFSIVLY